jgi:hypothetical protein
LADGVALDTGKSSFWSEPPVGACVAPEDDCVALDVGEDIEFIVSEGKQV